MVELGVDRPDRQFDLKQSPNPAQSLTSRSGCSPVPVQGL